MPGCLPWHIEHGCVTSAQEHWLTELWLTQLMTPAGFGQHMASHLCLCQALRWTAQFSWITARLFKVHPCCLLSEAPLEVMDTCQSSVTEDSMTQKILKMSGKGNTKTSFGFLYAAIKQLFRCTKRAGVG